jgi:hypothetical protein
VGGGVPSSAPSPSGVTIARSLLFVTDCRADSFPESFAPQPGDGSTVVILLRRIATW